MRGGGDCAETAVAPAAGTFDGVGFASQYVNGPNFADTGSTQAMSPILASSSMSTLPLPGNYHVQFPGFADAGQPFGLGTSLIGGGKKKKKAAPKKKKAAPKKK